MRAAQIRRPIGHLEFLQRPADIGRPDRQLLPRAGACRHQNAEGVDDELGESGPRRTLPARSRD